MKKIIRKCVDGKKETFFIHRDNNARIGQHLLYMILDTCDQVLCAYDMILNEEL